MGTRDRWIRAAFAVLTVAGGLMAAAVTSAHAGTAAPAVAGGCSATPQVVSEWGSGPSGGEIVQATVTNITAVTSTRWTVSWTPASGQQVITMWNAAFTPPGNGTATATAASLSYNGTLAPGASTTFGMELAGTGPLPVMICASDATPPPPPPPTVTLTLADAGSTINLQVGQTFAVSLDSPWHPEFISSPAVALVSATGGYPTSQPLLATYQAVAVGSAQTFLITDFACLHDPVNPCHVAQEEISFSVNVTS